VTPLARRLRSQLLSGRPAADPVAVAERLLAVQAQDPRAARLAVRARTRRSSAAGVDRALGDRALVVSWLNRGTLHLVRREDFFWLHALTVPPLMRGTARRLDQEGVSPAAAERGVKVIERSLGDEGPLTRAQLRDRLDAAGVPTKGQALVHTLALASHRGLVLRGPIVEREQAFVLVRDWLGPPETVDRDRALAELARRFLAGHAPADARDLARWAGVTVGAARAGLAAIASELDERPDGLLELSARSPAAEPELPPPRLLGGFEPVLLGWTSREEIIGRHLGLVTTNGIFRAFALVGGRAVATWGLADRTLRIEPLQRISRADRAALDADGEDVLRFLSG
jgi:hypothetical protein